MLLLKKKKRENLKMSPPHPGAEATAEVEKVVIHQMTTRDELQKGVSLN